MWTQINQEISDLYDKNQLRMDVSLNWILGYIDNDCIRKITDGCLRFDGSFGNSIELPDTIIQEISPKINPSVDIKQAINLLLLCAFILGGSE